jgi:phage tail-like protein
MSVQPQPWAIFNYYVQLMMTGGTKPLGGFFQVSGLTRPLLPGGLRSGSNPAMSTSLRGHGDVTLKRGVVDSSELWNWIGSVRTGDGAADRYTALITLRDEAGQPEQTWRLSGATPKRWSGPSLSGKGDGDVAIEELVLSAENITIVPR